MQGGGYEFKPPSLHPASCILLLKDPVNKPPPIFPPPKYPQMITRLGDHAVIISPHQGPAPPQRFNPLWSYALHDRLAPIPEPHKLRRPIRRNAHHFHRLRLGIKQQRTGS